MYAGNNVDIPVWELQRSPQSDENNMQWGKAVYNVGAVARLSWVLYEKRCTSDATMYFKHIG